MFAFWGRRENIDIQLPYIRRILDQNPNVEFHAWDLCRTPTDHRHLRTITGDRVIIRRDFYRPPKASRGQVKVWNHYTSNRYADNLFVKIDDDVVFLETDTFADFAATADANRDTIISAKVINNGACTALEPQLWDGFQALNIPLLDVHLSADYAEMSHRWFFDNWPTIINRSPKLHPTEDWLSINTIAFDYQMCTRIAALIGTPSPSHISQRNFGPHDHIGDEGAVNMLPRTICENYVAAHLSFGPQSSAAPPEQMSQWRKLYTEISDQYLAAPTHT